MKMKPLVAAIGAALFVACGAGVEDPSVEAVDTTPHLATKQQLACDGFVSEGVSQCSFKCDSNWTIYVRFQLGTVPYGQCQSRANTFCGYAAYSTCWTSWWITP